MNWYLILVKPNAHFVAQDNLKRQGYEVFLPLILKTSRTAKKFQTAAVPLFPSYLFIGSNIEQIPWKSVNATRGVSKVVTLDGVYRPIDKNIISGLKCRCDRDNIIKAKSKVQVGDHVKINNGPFNNFICEVEKINDQQRVWVLMELMKQKTRSLVSLDSITSLH